MYDKKKNLDALTEKLSALKQEMKGRKTTNDDIQMVAKYSDTCERIMAGEEIDVIGTGYRSAMSFEDPMGDKRAGGQIEKKAGTPGTLKRATDDKSYRSLFGDGLNYRWTDKKAGFFDAALSGLYHPDLVTRAAIEGVGSDGGFWVPSETAAKIHEVSLEDEIVMPRALVQPMQTNEFKIPAYAIGNHSNNLAGGFIAYYKPETGALTEANPAAREINLKAKKLTGLIRMSRELLDDKVEGEKGLIRTMGQGLGWYRDRFFLKGSGAGEPLGILNSPCLITQPKETSQSADTILYANLAGMVSRLAPACFNNSVFICHVSTIDQLLQLSIPCGTGGGFYSAMSESNGKFTLLSRPVTFTEKTEKIGDKGDVILADMSQYVIGLRVGMRFAVDASRYFESDDVVAKVIERHDGQPLWNEALTLEDGTTEVSPFVVLAERA